MIGVRAVLDAPDALLPFVDARVLGPADVHVATTLTRHLGDVRDEVLLAAALAVRAPRRDHVCVDLSTVHDRLGAELAETVDGGSDVAELLATLPWPEPDMWLELLATSPLIAVRDPVDLTEPDDAGRDVRPLTLAGPRLYLDRYWRYERRVAAALDERARRQVPVHDPVALAGRIDELSDGTAPDRQRLATAMAATSGLTILAGGPGTGKTTTVSRLLAILATDARASGRPLPHVALAAPTGKAAARLTASLREAAGDDGARSELLGAVEATTLHRLLGYRGSRTRFRHHRGNPLPHDVVVIDETSMVPLALLAKLVDATRPDARLVLVGDPHQLASVEAGSVLADLVGDPALPPRRSAARLTDLRALAGPDHLADTDTAPTPGIHDALVVLDRVHRFQAGSGIDRFAAAVRTGDVDAAVTTLADADDLDWIEPGALDATGSTTGRGAADDPYGEALRPVRERMAAVGARVLEAARAGDGVAALAALDAVRVLCAHRRGPDGVHGWNLRIESWLREDVGLTIAGPWYPGRPVLVTANDPQLRLWNGDVGVVVATGDRVAVAFPATDGAGVRLLAPSRIGHVETVHASTVHKAQGSQVDHAVVILPEPASPLCTRELLYTAVTRARTGATLVATEAAVRATIATRTERASGLGVALGRER